MILFFRRWDSQDDLAAAYGDQKVTQADLFIPLSQQGAVYRDLVIVNGQPRVNIKSV